MSLAYLVFDFFGYLKYRFFNCPSYSNNKEYYQELFEQPVPRRRLQRNRSNSILSQFSHLWLDLLRRIKKDVTQATIPSTTSKCSIFLRLSNTNLATFSSPFFIIKVSIYYYWYVYFCYAFRKLDFHGCISGESDIRFTVSSWGCISFWFILRFSLECTA